MIHRRDTGEPVASVRAYGKDAADAEARLGAAVAERLRGLGPPGDWGRDPTVPRLLRAYLDGRDRRYGFRLRAEEAAWPGEAARARAEGAEYEAHLAAELRARVAALTPAQRRELLTAVPEQWAARWDEPALETITAKRDLGRDVPDPTPEEAALMGRLQEALDTPPEG